MGACLAKPAAADRKSGSTPEGKKDGATLEKIVEEEDTLAPLPSDSLDSVSTAKKKAQQAWQEYARARDRRSAPRLSALRSAQELDVAFVVDATGSMGCHVALVKEKISATIAAVKARFPSAKVRVAFIGYRDYGETINKIGFTADVKAFETALARVKVSGGGDLPEDVFSGLEAAAKLEWSSAVRLVIHIADAPCHGREFYDRAKHTNIDDKYPDGDKHKRELATVLRALHAGARVQTYHFYHLNDYTKQMLAQFRQATGVPAGWIQEDTFSNIEGIPSRISQHSQTAISSSLLRESGGSSEGFAALAVDTAEPDWDGIGERKAEEYAIMPMSAEDVVERVKFGKRLKFATQGARALKIAPAPFSADGALRWPYYTLIGPEDGAEDDPEDGARAATTKRVLKRFKTPLDARVAALRQSEASYKEQAEEQFVASVLVERFNQLYPGAVRERLVFLQLNLVKVAFGESAMRHQWYTVEDFLDGHYKKFSCNVGDFSPEYSDILQAFTHWTYEFSGGELMITDLQGIKGPDEDTYYLTDPAIHCRDLDHFSRLNWGEEGFAMFFAAHKCNKICAKLKLKPRTATSPRSPFDSPFK